MKKYIINGLFLFSALSSMLFTSCYKKFDTKSYQPEFTINGFTSSSAIGDGSLVGYWAFEGSYIDSVSKTAGTGVSTSFTPGIVGQSLQGVNNGYVLSDLTDGIKNLSSFTVDFWINNPMPAGVFSPFCVAGTDVGWQGILNFYFDNNTSNSSNFKLHYTDDQTTPNEQWLTLGALSNPWNSWVNIAVTYNATSSTFNLYQGGTLVLSQTISGLGNLVLPATASNIIFGALPSETTPPVGTDTAPQDWQGFLTGQLDEVRVYNKALTQTELQALIILQGKGK